MSKKIIKLFFAVFLIFTIFGVTLHADAPQHYKSAIFEEIRLSDNETYVVKANIPTFSATADALTRSRTLPEYYGRKVLSGMENSTALLYAYDQIVAGLSASAGEISVYNGTNPISEKQFLMVFDMVRRDHTELFWLSQPYSYSTYPSTVVSLLPQYILSGEALTNAKAKFDAQVDDILSGITPDMTELERELYIHDTLAKRIVYDLNAPNAHNPYGAIVEGRAVCEGYAEAFQYLLQRAGIQSYIVVGESKGVGHAWNLVKIDGQYYYVDLTWNDQDSYTFHAYFNITTAELLKDHSIDSTAYPIPNCTATAANFFIVNDLQMQVFELQRFTEIMKAGNGIAGIHITGSSTTFIDAVAANMGNIANNLGYQISGLSCMTLGCETVFVLKEKEDAHSHSFTVQNPINKFLKSAATCSKPAVYYYSCQCGQQGTSTFEYGTLAPHTFDNACDTSCNACGYTRATTHSYEQKYDTASHWQECTVCGDKHSIIAHTFDNACDTSCSACSYTRTITHSYKQKYDATNHWQQCSVCGDKHNVTAHIFDNACDTSCNACGYTRATTHSYEQKYDTASHWQQCSVCGDKQNVTAHTFSQKYNENDHWEECTCGYIRNTIAHTLNDGKCTQCEFGHAIPGDLNNDGKPDARDLVLMRRYIAKLEVTINKAAADINGDGKVNASDLVMLRRIIAGLAG